MNNLRIYIKKYDCSEEPIYNKERRDILDNLKYKQDFSDERYWCFILTPEQELIGKLKYNFEIHTKMNGERVVRWSGFSDDIDRNHRCKMIFKILEELE